MSQDYNPFDPSRHRDQMDFMDKMNKARTSQEAQKQSRLLEEQVRLQKEANELEKKRQAQEQARLNQGYGQQAQQRTRFRCGPCGGTGTVHCLCYISSKTNTYLLSCPLCHGTGTATCTECNGTGYK